MASTVRKSRGVKNGSGVAASGTVKPVPKVKGIKAGKPRPGSRKPPPEQGSPIGRRLIAGMENLLATMKTGGLAAVEKKFTVRRVKTGKFEVPALAKEDVVSIRESLGVSQPVFASLLGVSAALVKAWEQGLKVPTGVALRFLAEIRRNPEYWKDCVRQAVEPA
jgi:DNA-binding transcriptional regulator YiaG